MLAQPTLGVIVGNRGFFPDHLANEGRKTILQVLQEENINAIALTPSDSAASSSSRTAMMPSPNPELSKT